MLQVVAQALVAVLVWTEQEQLAADSVVQAAKFAAFPL